MYPTRSGITFAATIEQPICPAKVTIYDDISNSHVPIQCTLVHGHRQKRHQFEMTADDTIVEVYWTKKPQQRRGKEKTTNEEAAA